MSVKAGDAYIDFHGDFTSLNKQVAATLGPLTSKFGRFGKAAAIGVAGITAAGVTAGASLFDIGSKFHEAYNIIDVGTGKTGKKLDGLRESFKSVVSSTPADFTDAANAITALNVRLGLTGKPLDRLAIQILNLSRITKTDLGENVTDISKLFNNWNINTDKQSYTLNKLFRLTQITGIGLSDLAGTMTQFGGPLRQLGFSFDTSAALIANLDKQGVSSTRIMPALIFAMKAFAKAGKDPAVGLRETVKEIEHLGKSSKATELAVKIFGGRAGPYLASAIEEGRFHLGKLIATMDHGHNTINKTAKETSTFGVKLNELKNKALVLLEPVAKRVFNAINNGLGDLMKFDWKGLYAETAGVRAGFASVGTTAIPMLEGLGQIIVNVGKEVVSLGEDFAPLGQGLIAIGQHILPVALGIGHLALEATQLAIGVGQSHAGLVLLSAAAGALLGRMIALGGAFAVGKIVEFVGGIRSMIATFGVLRAVYVAQTGVTNASTLSVLGYAAAQRIAAGASRGLAAAMASTGFGLFLVLAGTVAGALLGMSKSSDKAKISTQELTEAFRGEADAIRALREIDIEAAQRKANLTAATISVERAEQRVSQLRKEGKTHTLEYKEAENQLAQARLQRASAQRSVNDIESDTIKKQQDADRETQKRIGTTTKWVASLKAQADATKKSRSDKLGELHNRESSSQILIQTEGRSRYLQRNALITAELARETGKLASEESRLHAEQSKVDALQSKQEEMDKLAGKLKNLKQGTDAYKKTASQLAKVETELGNQLDGVVPKAAKNKGALHDLAGATKKTGSGFKSLSGNVSGLGTVLGEVSSYVSGDVNKLLKAFGAKPLKMTVKAFAPVKSFLSGFQRGGPITEGAPSGDTVPIMAERGEYMLNREAVKKVGKKALDRLNFGHAPRFQTGGLIAGIRKADEIDSHHYPYKWGGGHDPNFTPPYDCSGAWSAVERAMGVITAPLTSGQMMKLGKPGPGPAMILASLGHVYGALMGKWFGTSSQNPGGGAGWFNGGIRPGFTIRHFDVIGEMLKKLKIAGGTPTMDSIASGAAKDLVHAANEYIGKATSSITAGSGGAGTGTDIVSGDGSGLMREISKQHGWNFNDWWAVDAIETGHGRELVNPTSTARLRGQFLDMNWGKYGPGSDPRQNPSMAQQIQSMADYIAQRYGNPTAALQSEHTRGFYKTGGLIEQIKKTVNLLTGKHPKKQQKALSGLIKKIGGIGISASLKKQVEAYQQQSEIFGEHGDLAGQLNVPGVPAVPASGSTPEIPEVAEIPGKFAGQTQIQWVTQQLQSLFDWRNAMIRAREAVKAKLDDVAKAIGFAQKKLADVVTKIAEQAKLKEEYETDLKKLSVEGGKTKEHLQGQLAAARKAKKPDKSLVSRLQEQIRAMTGSTKQRADSLKARIEKITHDVKEETKQRDGLKGTILPALVKQRSGMSEDSKSYDSNLTTVQGAGGPMSVLPALPGLGTLGGSIFAAQLQLRDLEAPKTSVTDKTTAETPAEDPLLKQMLDEANQRAAVANRQFEVFKNLPPFGGVFHEGGTVPGPKGAERLILAQAGETILRADAGATPALAVHLHGDLVSSHPDPVQAVIGDRRFSVAVQQENRKAILQGRGSGRAGLLK